MPRPVIARALLDVSPDIICLLDADLRLIYCNPAWDRFAAENQARDCNASAVVGKNVMDIIPDPLARFFRTAFAVVSDSGEPFEFDYECSSALVFRMFRMRILPIAEPGEFMVVHALRIERPHDRAAVASDDARFRGTNGLVVMCCHCRRTRRAVSEGWDWVPDYLASMPSQVSTGICPACYLYFYPDVFAKRAAGGS